jgi:hypothetical protein
MNILLSFVAISEFSARVVAVLCNDPTVQATAKTFALAIANATIDMIGRAICGYLEQWRGDAV